MNDETRIVVEKTLLPIIAAGYTVSVITSVESGANVPSISSKNIADIFPLLFLNGMYDQCFIYDENEEYIGWLYFYYDGSEPNLPLYKKYGNNGVAYFLWLQNFHDRT